MTPPITPPEPPLVRPGKLSELFWGFSILALQGFGGVMAITQRELVERRRWLSREGFLEDWAVAQILPGPNVANLAIMLGDRFLGTRGALVSVAGLFAFPLLIVLLLGAGFASLSHLPEVQGIMRAMGMVVGALIIATAIKLIPALRAHPGGQLFCLLSGIATIVLIVVFKWALIWVVLVVGGLSCIWTYRRLSALSSPSERTP